MQRSSVTFHRDLVSQAIVKASCLIYGYAGLSKIAYACYELSWEQRTVDPVFGVCAKKLLIVVGVLEVIISFLGCVLARKHALFLVCWLSYNILLYRILMILHGSHHYCGCFGGMNTGIIKQSADYYPFIIVSTMLVLSSMCLWREWNRDIYEKYNGKNHV